MFKEKVFWHDTVVMPSGQKENPLPEKVDVAVIGGGYTGLTAALTLAKRNVKVAVSEAESIGKIAYVQDSKVMSIQQAENMYFIDEPTDDLIKQGDELFIKVNSSDEISTNFNQDRTSYSSDPSLYSYTVTDEGIVKLPYIGKVKLEGLTLIEASDLIEMELSQYLDSPSVFMRFVNNKVTILGEVNAPGVYVFNYKNINIFQALGYANDIATFGNRKNVTIVREEGDYRSKHTIDLTSDALLASEFYMINSNDIIYVEPLRQKKWGMDTFPYDLFLSVASLTIVVLTFYVTYLYN